MTAPTTRPRSLEPGDRVANKYEVRRLLGEGGMGAVYEVVHVRTKKRFALKWMMPELAGSSTAAERFLREAQSACALEHPNVVQIFDVERDQGGMYSLMELLTGESLGERLERGPVPAERLIRIVLPLLHGLHAAHAQGVVHRDLKPDNLFLSRSAGAALQPKILDFGLSKLNDRGPSAPRLTRTGAIMGTPAYMPPEQARDASLVDVRGDVYAMGAVLYEALTGQLPFEAPNIIELLLRITDEPPAPLRVIVPSIPASLEATVLRSLAKHPDDRPQTARELALSLCDAVGLPHDLYAPGPAHIQVGELDPTEELAPFVPREAGPERDTDRELVDSDMEPTAIHAGQPAPPRRKAGRAGWLLMGVGMAAAVLGVTIALVIASSSAEPTTSPAPTSPPEPDPASVSPAVEPAVGGAPTVSAEPADGIDPPDEVRPDEVRPDEVRPAEAPEAVRTAEDPPSGPAGPSQPTVRTPDPRATLEAPSGGTAPSGRRRNEPSAPARTRLDPGRPDVSEF